jgi:hypothetical protein
LFERGISDAGLRAKVPERGELGKREAGWKWLQWDQSVASVIACDKREAFAQGSQRVARMRAR